MARSRDAGPTATDLVPAPMRRANPTVLPVTRATGVRHCTNPSMVQGEGRGQAPPAAVQLLMSLLEKWAQAAARKAAM